MRQKVQAFGQHKLTILLIAAAVILLLSGGLASARAALVYYSENYTAQVTVYDIGVTLVETSAQGTKNISSRDYSGSNDEWNETQGALLTDMLAESEGELELGRAYTEELSVLNSGNIDTYVRVRIRKSWLDADGDKVSTLSPDLIILNMTDNGWIVDEDASTEEQLVLYWPEILEAGETTAALSDTICIDSAIASNVTETTSMVDGLTTITTVFNYDGVRFHIEAEADAIQTHNAQDAIRSAWGVDVEIAEDGTLSLAP